MGSTRLPGKVLIDLGGESVLSRVVRRLRQATLIDEIVVATTISAADNAIVSECRRFSVAVFRGEENDVLDRYYHAARWVGADAVVRITSDCPLIDAEVTDNTIREFLSCSPDYASNALQRTYPRGLDTEVVTRQALTRAWQEARFSYQRAHVTPYIYENPNSFYILAVRGEVDYSDYRWTLDTPEDLAFIRAICERMGNDDGFSWRDVLALLQREPELTELNREVRQKALQEG
jgi:spore coat polysaccharide biosynthesis protein SpsF